MKKRKDGVGVMSEEFVRRALRRGKLDHARELAGLPEPFSPGQDCPATRLVQESNRFKALGRIEEGKGRVVAAEVCYRIALRFVPGDWEALGAVGRLLAQQGRSDEAQPYLRAAIWLTRGPVRAQLHVIRGRLRLREGWVAGAWRDMCSASRQDPQNADSMEALEEIRRLGVPLWVRISPTTYLAAVCLAAGVLLWGRDLGHVLFRFFAG